jgi:UDP-N-acetylmuramyl pentapeptide phosphotransferase/UDP-N-acetylglucosamine-1-phosphate transferase
MVLSGGNRIKMYTKQTDIMLILYLLTVILLFLGMIFYFKLAGKYNIIDKPNQRSSHDYITIRGGGIVFWLAALLYLLYLSR